MDKNTLVGFILIGAVIVGFGIYNRPSQEERARAQHYQDSIQQVIKQQQEAQEKQAAAAIEAAIQYNRMQALLHACPHRLPPLISQRYS